MTTSMQIQPIGRSPRVQKNPKPPSYGENSFVAQVGKRIRLLRTEQGMSLRDFGKHAGVHPFHVMDIERGNVAPNLNTLRAVAKGLGVTPADLLNCGNDDLGQIFELLQKHPKMVPTILAKAKSKAGALQ